MKSLTVVAVTGSDVDAHSRAILRTLSCLPWRSIRLHCLLVSPETPPSWFLEDWLWIPEMTRELYSAFITHRLADVVHTDFALVVQADGYALHSDKWDPEFLEYDYIGAPWPSRIVDDPYCRVGNGGFSLRSHRLMEATRKLAGIGDTNEDVWIAQVNRPRLESEGIRFAPIDVAMRFAMEFPIEEYPDWKIEDSFGFHAIYSGREALRL